MQKKVKTVNNILKNTEKIKNKIIEYRRIIHENPELAFNEIKTCEYIAKILEKLEISYEIVCNTGIVAKIGKTKTQNNPQSSYSKENSEKNNENNENNEKCIAFRADIDALPIQENTNLSYSSKNQGVMHACGHDMHIAMLLGAAEILKKNENKLNGIIKLIFQPAEELFPGGAKMMIENGVLKNPKPQIIFAQHVNPAENVGTFSVSKTEAMAATCEIYWTVRGKGAHAAQPHLGNDTILVAANIISFAQFFMTKYKNPLDFAVLSICSINGGFANNIFPDEVKMSGTLRTFDENLRDYYLELLAEKCQNLAKIYDVECIFEVKKGYPPIINDEKVVEILRESVSELFGAENFSICEPKMLADDFSYFSREIPACFYFIGAKDLVTVEHFPLHSSQFNPSEEILTKGASLIVSLAEKFLS